MTGFTPELGQWGFSNSPWQEIETPGYVTAGFEVIAAAIGEQRGDWSDGWGALTSNAGGEEYVNGTFAMRSYCWCDGGRPGHEDGCPPNFEHFASGIKAAWYEHAERGESINRLVGPGEWGKVLSECLASVSHSTELTER